MSRTYTSVISSPIGKIGIAVENNKLIKMALLPPDAELLSPKDAADKSVVDEIKTYFKNPKHVFKTSLVTQGTPFQQKIWSALQEIPSGKTLTYGDLAKRFKTSPRAIGQACRTNRVLLVIPCHRIVAANNLGGFGGAKEGSWLETKKWLLQHEKA